MKHSFRMWFSFVTAICAIMALVASTYAWFSTNKQVSTNLATARTGEETLELQISTKGGANFADENPTSIKQVNSTDKTWLLPVSTSDLQQFVYSPNTVEDKASVFKEVTDEGKYYHGRIYLRATGSGWPEDTRLDLYLDESGGVLGENVSGELLTAARLGLLYDEGESGFTILRLSDKVLSDADRAYNTVVDGETLGDNQVLKMAGGKVTAVSDPSVLVDDRVISFENGQANVPDKPLLTMKIGKIYQIDVYFYLEGCDPDCSSSVSFDSADIHLAFYGVLSKEGK